MDPNFASAHFELAATYSLAGKHEEALAAVERGLALLRNNPEYRDALICIYARAGRKEEARRVLAEIKELSRQKYYSPFGMAVNHACLGDNDQAFTWLERAFEQRASGLMYLKTVEAFEPLRDDPRYRDLLRRMNFPEN